MSDPVHSTAPETPENAHAAEQQQVQPETVADAPVEASLSAEQNLAAERDEWREKAYRLAAEMENLRRRTAKEVEDTRKFAISTLAKELLSVADNMERTLDTLKNGNAEQTVLDGVEMVNQQLMKVFDRMDVAKIDALGQKMDPNLHQVMVQIPDATVAPGTVVQVMQAGYTLNGRLLRPAMVATAKMPDDGAPQ